MVMRILLTIVLPARPATGNLTVERAAERTLIDYVFPKTPQGHWSPKELGVPPNVLPRDIKPVMTREGAFEDAEICSERRRRGSRLCRSQSRTAGRTGKVART